MPKELSIKMHKKSMKRSKNPRQSLLPREKSLLRTNINAMLKVVAKFSILSHHFLRMLKNIMRKRGEEMNRGKVKIN